MTARMWNQRLSQLQSYTKIHIFKLQRKKQEKQNDLSRVTQLEAEPVPETKSTTF